MDDSADANFVPLVEACNDDVIAESEDFDDTELADEVNNQLLIEQPKQQKYKNVDELLGKHKYWDLLATQKCFFLYNGRQKNPRQNKMANSTSWTSIATCRAENTMKNCPWPRGLAKRVKTLPQLLELFFANEMLEKIKLNDSIESVLELSFLSY